MQSRKEPSFFLMKDRSSAWGVGQAYEAIGQMFVTKLPECLELMWGQGINWTKGGYGSIFQFLFLNHMVDELVGCWHEIC